MTAKILAILNPVCLVKRLAVMNERDKRSAANADQNRLAAITLITGFNGLIIIWSRDCDAGVAEADPSATEEGRKTSCPESEIKRIIVK